MWLSQVCVALPVHQSHKIGNQLQMQQQLVWEHIWEVFLLALLSSLLRQSLFGKQTVHSVLFKQSLNAVEYWIVFIILKCCSEEKNLNSQENWNQC